MAKKKPQLGISSCLLGARVRFDGAHKKDEWLLKELGKWVDWIPLCPEMEMGLGAPRESMRLVTDGEKVSLLSNKTQTDLTALAIKTSAKLVRALPELEGYVLKKNSPTCGLERVKVYQKDIPFGGGQGFFAQKLQSEHPNLPMIEEGRLTDPEQREHFVTRVFALHRFKSVATKTSAIQDFHQQYKLLLMAHSPAKYRELGKMAANSEKALPSDLKKRYGALFMTALAEASTTKKRVNVLQHIFGYFKKAISATEKQGIVETIEEFRLGEISFLAALTCVKQLLRRESMPYLEKQLFFDPYPKALSLRRYL